MKIIALHTTSVLVFGLFSGAFLASSQAVAQGAMGAPERSGLARVLRPAEVNSNVLGQFRPDHRYELVQSARHVDAQASSFGRSDQHAQFRPLLVPVAAATEAPMPGVQR